MSSPVLQRNGNFYLRQLLSEHPAGEWVSKAEARYEWSVRLPPEWFERRAAYYVRNHSDHYQQERPPRSSLVNFLFAMAIKNLYRQGHIERLEDRDPGARGGDAHAHYHLRITQAGRDFHVQEQGVLKRRQAWQSVHGSLMPPGGKWPEVKP